MDTLGTWNYRGGKIAASIQMFIADFENAPPKGCTSNLVLKEMNRCKSLGIVFKMC